MDKAITLPAWWMKQRGTEMKRTIYAAMLLASTAFTALPAKADTVLMLVGPAPNHNPIGGNVLGPQSESNPCVIAGTNCSNPTTPGLGFNNYTPNNDPAYDRWSTSAGGSNGTNVPDGQHGVPYNALALVLAAGGITFNIAVDVNTTAAASERLQSFEIWDSTTNTRLAHYTGPADIATGISNNGNGWADFLLTGFSFVGSGVLPTDGIEFHAKWTGAVDGAESFFIVGGSGGTVINPQCPDNICAVPGPVTGASIPGLLAACFGMFGLRTWRRRRNGENLKPIS